MVSIDTHALHAISWVDLAAKDLDAAMSFYAGLFGWTATSAEGDVPYTIITANDKPVAGAMALTPEMGDMPPVWSVYVNVEDADATIAAATAAGGTVFQEPFEIPDDGRIAVIADPAGAVICLFEGGSVGMTVMDEPGAPCWFECMSRDVAASIGFYEAVFGWATESMEMGPDMTYNVFSNGDDQICGAMAIPPMVPAEVPSHWVVNFAVPDCDAAVAYATDNGATVTMPPMDTPYGRAAGLMDPWGAVLTVIDRSTATAE